MFNAIFIILINKLSLLFYLGDVVYTWFDDEEAKNAIAISASEWNLYYMGRY